jgi:ferritin-like metal-binding protein YciE
MAAGSSAADLMSLKAKIQFPSNHENKKPMKTLINLFEVELQDIYDAEHRIAKALSQMAVAEAATCSELQAAFVTRLRQTKDQINKLVRVLIPNGVSFGGSLRSTSHTAE